MRTAVRGQGIFLLSDVSKPLIIGIMVVSKENSWRFKKTITVISPYFKRYAFRLLVGFLALVLVDFFQLWIPRVIKWAVDDLQQGVATPSGLLKYGAYIVLLALSIGGMRYCWRFFILGFSRLLEMHLRNRIFSHVLSLDKAFFQRKPTGEIMALMTNDLASVQLATGMGLVAFVDAVIMSIAAVSFMAYINPTLTAIAVIPMPLLAISTRFLSAKLHRRFKRVQEEFSMLTEFARATISTIRMIKAYNQERAQTERFNGMGERYVQDNLKLATIQGTLFPISIFMANTSLLLVIFFGGKLTIRGTITAGDFVAFISYLFMLSWPMMALGWVTNLFQRGITSLDRIRTLLLERPLLEDPAGPLSKRKIKGKIRIEDLSFSYPNQENRVLKNITLDIDTGILGIVGRTGSGKTTLCHVLARLYPVADGSVFLDGMDANTIPLADVRSAFSYVPQETIIFSDTIAANIAIGKPGAKRKEIEEAARAAAIHEEIVLMPDGYETRVGEKGVKLSGGQKQRLAIARALLLKRPILVIDDGLSAVDMETEQKIIQSISRYLKDRTCIIVSHRIMPLVDAREIVVMDEGMIVAKGSHHELLEKSLFYATIYDQQTVCVQ